MRSDDPFALKMLPLLWVATALQLGQEPGNDHVKLVLFWIKLPFERVWVEQLNATILVPVLNVSQYIREGSLWAGGTEFRTRG